MVPGSRLVIVLLVVSAVGSLVAQGQNREPLQEFHLSADAARTLYTFSAFAHGHRHGYEEGFRFADLTIHLGGLQRELRERDVPKSMGYKREFGEKKRFRQGFIYGFIAGYNDSFSERSFRVPEWGLEETPIASLSALPQWDGPLQLNPELRAAFDEGMFLGYRAGMVSQAAPAPEDTSLREKLAGSCRGTEQAAREGFCDGFTQGFLMGMNDRPPSGPDAGLARQNLTPAALGHVP